MPSQMPNLYLDHSVAAHEAWWPHIDAILSAGDCRLALSLWNLYEVGEATDPKQRERRLVFLERHNPLWIVERLGVQSQEVKRFVWTNHFRVAADDVRVFVPRLSMVEAFMAGAKTRIGLTSRAWIDGTDFARHQQQKNLAPHAQWTGRHSVRARNNPSSLGSASGFRRLVQMERHCPLRKRPSCSTIAKPTWTSFSRLVRRSRLRTR